MTTLIGTPEGSEHFTYCCGVWIHKGVELLLLSLELWNIYFIYAVMKWPFYSGDVAKIKIQNQPIEGFLFNGNNWEIPYN